ncbi:hypothetical protein ACWF94_32305, partial [Streptomyces sp. NPDC055078]
SSPRDDGRREPDMSDQSDHANDGASSSATAESKDGASSSAKAESKDGASSSAKAESRAEGDSGSSRRRTDPHTVWPAPRDILPRRTGRPR